MILTYLFLQQVVGFFQVFVIETLITLKIELKFQALISICFRWKQEFLLFN